MDFETTVHRDYNSPDREVLFALLFDFNKSVVPSRDAAPISIIVKQSHSGQAVGGLLGKFFYEWLFIELLFLPESMRHLGLGGSLLRQAEQIAIDEGSNGVWLDTFDFQARGFYEKLGYTVFGSLVDHPKDRTRFFLQKRLSTET